MCGHELHELTQMDTRLLDSVKTPVLIRVHSWQFVQFVSAAPESGMQLAALLQIQTKSYLYALETTNWNQPRNACKRMAV